ncbi:hypothetical protein Bca4012_099967 [Brassica carinata]
MVVRRRVFSNEAASLAGHWRLGKLIAFTVTITFPLMEMEMACCYIWVKNRNTGYVEISAAIKEAKAVTDKSTLIKVWFDEMTHCLLCTFLATGAVIRLKVVSALGSDVIFCLLGAV